MKKSIIVEGKTDRERLLMILDEEVDIFCTYGTISDDRLEGLIDETEYDEIFVLVDADEAGQRLRRIIKHEFPNFRHLYTRKKYKEVAATPLDELAKILHNAHFSVKEIAVYIPQ